MDPTSVTGPGRRPVQRLIEAVGTLEVLGRDEGPNHVDVELVVPAPPESDKTPGAGVRAAIKLIDVASRRTLVRNALAGIVVLVLALTALRLGSLERGGAAHAFVSIGDGIPATLYLPFDDDEGELPYQQPEGERPPVVVLAHGYSADQNIMSPMARSLAEAGYAVLTFDFRGHGSNTHRFEGDLTDDLTAVVDHLERSPQVDGDRIAVLGHSMGASAALDFATLDERPVAVIPVSGGDQLHDAVQPEHVLLMVAENDPGFIHDRQANLADDLADSTTEIVTSEIGGTDHISILFSNTAVTELVGYLDPIMGVERVGDTPGLDDPRLPVAAGYLLLAMITIGLLGLLIGRVVEPAESDATAGGLLLVAAALALTYPVMAVGGINTLPLGAGQPVVVQLGLAAGLLWALRALVQREVVTGRVATWLGTGRWLPLRSVGVAGLAGGLSIFVLFLPLASVIHRLVPTPERLVYWVLLTAVTLPFFATFETLVRRGGTWAAIGWGLLGRLVLLLVLVVGLGVGVLPPVIGLVVPLLIGQYVVLEIFAATCYARGRNPAVIAVTESIVIAWIAVTLTPIG